MGLLANNGVAGLQKYRIGNAVTQLNEANISFFSFMKKFDFVLGDGRDVLSREQMKTVKGGLRDGYSCSYQVYNSSNQVIYSSGSGSCGSSNIGTCGDAVESQADFMTGAIGGSYNRYQCS